MITKEELLAVATDLGLLPTTVNKDYALSWFLAGIDKSSLSRWIFKGGTCLKKAYFDTYRFSEDLDFTVPTKEAYNDEIIFNAIQEASQYTYELSGVEFLDEDISVIPSVNKRNAKTYQVKLPFQGPLRQQAKSIQRIKFDITQDEILVSEPESRTIFNGYSDSPIPPAKVLCYSVNEIIAEKTRALYERQGRARDVYDVVNISRNFRETIDATEAKKILEEKFKFKNLPSPTVDLILSQIDQDLLKQNWDHQLKHQLQILPPVESYLQDLKSALNWWIDNITPKRAPAMAVKPGEEPVPRQLFSAIQPSAQAAYPGSYILNQIRFAARNHLYVTIKYKGVDRLVEPYSLRIKGTGNLLLYVYELKRGLGPGGGVKAFKVHEIQSAKASGEAFRPRFAVEL